MLNIELNHNELTNPGLYIMRWKGRTGLVRLVGTPSTGLTIIQPEKSAEAYMGGLPANGAIPPDAAFSEPLAIIGS